MIRSMFTAISSLNLNQNYLDVISDNLANSNTNRLQKPAGLCFKINSLKL